MDCEKFEPLLLDELYEELDEVTSAAVKRHVSGCARCASILNGMRSTRRLASLPMLEVPEGLEDRILSAVKETGKVVPLVSRAYGPDAEPAPAQSRAARALSWAGSWAMRPQTAMAAVFLLMIGTSAIFIRSRQSGDQASAVAVSVTEQGAPAGQTAPADDHDSLDNKAAAAAHGANQPAPITAPPSLLPSPVGSAASAVALNADPVGNAVGVADAVTGGKGRPAKADESRALGSALAAGDPNIKDKNNDDGRRDEEKKVAARRASDMSNAAAPAGAPPPPADDYAARGQAVAPPLTKSQGQDPQDGFSAGMAAYRARNFAEAQRQFDGAARSGDPNSALWAAKAVKDGTGGCGAALPRFDAVAQKSSGTWIGNEAQLESARCQIVLGQLDAARDKLTRLTSVPSHAAQAQQALNDLNQVASKREADRAKGGAGTGRPAAAAPARAPASPKAATTQSGY